jgi:hypothetical protein
MSLIMKMKQMKERLLAQMKVVQEKMDRHQEKIITKTDAHQERREVWIEGTEVFVGKLEASREKSDALAEHQEVSKGEAAVETIVALEDRYWDRHLILGRHPQPKIEKRIVASSTRLREVSNWPWRRGSPPPPPETKKRRQKYCPRKR